MADSSSMDDRREKHRTELIKKSKGLSLSPRELYDQLGPLEKWREHIDGRHHGYGSEVYKQGLHRKPQVKEPNYNDRMMAADRVVASTLSEDGQVRPLTVDDYQAIHRATSQDGSAHRLRTDELPIRFEHFNDDPNQLKQEADPYIARFEDAPHDPDKFTKHVVLRKVDDPLGEVDKVLKEYYHDLSQLKSPTDDQRLEVIAKAHRRLENLHPYVDHNSRTNRLVLNRMLVENGMTPTILENPLDVHHTSQDHWIAGIKKGQLEWERHAMEITNSKDQWGLYNNFVAFKKMTQSSEVGVYDESGKILASKLPTERSKPVKVQEVAEHKEKEPKRGSLSRSNSQDEFDFT